eukprot:549600-Pelagomonas_calceolata.AAC.1
MMRLESTVMKGGAVFFVVLLFCGTVSFVALRLKRTVMNMGGAVPFVQILLWLCFPCGIHARSTRIRASSKVYRRNKEP